MSRLSCLLNSLLHIVLFLCNIVIIYYLAFMYNYISISECCIDKSKDVPQDIADKLLTYHIAPMNYVRHLMGAPVICSLSSGWRPLEWELSRDRSGKSQHVFIDKGAIDWTAEDLKVLFELILEHTDYKRIAVYPANQGNFLHCDHLGTERKLFISNSRSQWKSATVSEILNVL